MALRHSAFFIVCDWEDCMKKEVGKKQDNLKAIVAEIKSAAKLYKEYLVGRKFIYVF